MIRLYAWINSKAVDLPENFVVQLNELEEVIQRINGQKLRFVREARIKHFSQSDKEINNAVDSGLAQSLVQTEEDKLFASITQTEKDCEDTLKFFAYCQEFLQKQVGVHSYFVVLTYLIASTSPPENIQDKMEILFAKFIELDKDNALIFYKDHQAKFSELFPASQLLVENVIKKIDVESAKNKLKEFEPLLRFENDSLGIVQLFREKSDPEELAALILLLLNKGVTDEQLIKSNVLQDFLTINIIDLSSTYSDNKIKRFYGILSEFNDARGLIELAKKTYITIPNYKVIFSLFGEKQEEQVPLTNIEDTFRFTITSNNFNNLYHLFGNPFLLKALQVFANSEDNALKELLITCINGKKVNSLANFIMYVVWSDRSLRLCEPLAKIINAEKSKELINAHQGAIFHLAQYCSDILGEINANQGTMDDFGNFIINLVDEPSQDEFTTLLQLIALLISLGDKSIRQEISPNLRGASLQSNSIIAYKAEELLYTEIIKFILNKMIRFDIEGIIPLFKLWTQKYGKITEKLAKQLVEALENSVRDTIFSSFSKDACHHVYDIWSESQRKFNFLKRLNSNIDISFPTNESALYVYIIKMAIEKSVNVNLKNFLENIIEPEIGPADADAVSKFERALIEIMLMVDDQQIREAARTLLETTPRRGNQWLEHKYDGKIIFVHAIVAGNLGAIKFLSSYYKKDAVAEILCMAVFSGKLDIVKFLCEMTTDNKPDIYAVGKLVIKATFDNHLIIVKFLYAIISGYQFASEIVVEALEVAAHMGWRDIVEFFCSIDSNHRPNDDAITKALRSAIIGSKLDIVEFLCTKTTDNRPDSKAVAEALCCAVINGKLDIVKFLCGMTTDNRPDSDAVAEALYMAARNNRLDMVEFICTMTSDNKPISKKVANILERANSTDKLGVSCLEQARNILILYESINDLKIHGQNLEKAGYKNNAENLANELTTLSDRFVSSLLSGKKNEITSIQIEFQDKLQEGYRTMGNHRALWKPILVNIAIAATGIGLLVVVGKLLVTRTCFFGETVRQNKIKSIGKTFDQTIKFFESQDIQPDIIKGTRFN
jgi:hypothetical protein